VKQAMFSYVNHARFRSWNQAVLNKHSKVSCSRKKRNLLKGLKLVTGRFRAKRATHETKFE